MSDYTKTTNFAAKDSLPSGNSGKIVKGSEIDTEFTNIQTAVATKLDINNSALTGTTTAQTLTVSTLLDITSTTDASDATGDTGALRTEGGASIAKKLFVGTDLDVDGTTNLDVVDIDGAVNMASTALITGVLTTTAATVHTNGITMPDNAKAIFGTGSDLQIYHDGTDSYITEVGNGNLIVRAAGGTLFQGATAGESLLTLLENGAVTAYYDNAAKLATTSTGIDVTGVITTDGMTTSADINFGDNDKAIFGAGSDLQIYHDGLNSYIVDAGTGDLYFRSASNLYIGNAAGTQSYITATDGGAVDLRYNGSAKLATTSTGIDVTGTVTAEAPSGASRINVGTGSVAGDHGVNVVSGGANNDYGVFFNGSMALGSNTTSGTQLKIGSNGSETTFQTLTLHTNATERMRIDSSGNLLVGKTSATATGSGTELRGTQVIIGKTSSGTVNGIFFNHNSSYVGGLNYTDSATSLVTSSDERLKESIADADDAGSKIDAMQVRQFDWKTDGSHQEYGFVAQELEPVFGHAVHTAEDDMQTKGVDYASLVPMLVKEIQSLRARVQQLENS